MRVRDEIAAIDASLTTPRAPVHVAATDLYAVDLDRHAARAIVDSDERSTCCGGRFGTCDIRAGAISALSRAGVVAERNQLDGVIEDDPPLHVKAFMATETVRAKARLAGHLDALARPWRSLLPGELQRFVWNEDLSALHAS